MSSGPQPPKISFQKRLRSLIGDRTVSGFAREVGLSESLVRKYLQGSEPTLSKARQIARNCNVTIDWLAGDQSSASRR
ncbi:MAG: helix-turn-helix domain-containing protein [Natronospirillum sp.]|uniref:helix-turn-helix domain-containing protein n=1 Tax=Natronospirillum sp. TaxID=2812955 RepID=UPI002A1E23B5|nr:helix-turn-helix domain-containing protein [Natronospirillum sp.]